MVTAKSGTSFLFNDSGDAVGVKDTDGDERMLGHSLSHIDLQIRSVEHQMPTVPTVITGMDVIVKRGKCFDYNADTGVITFCKNGIYWHDFLINTHSTGNNTIYAGAQINIGDGWVASRYSGRKMPVTSQVDGQGMFQSNNPFLPESYSAGFQLRFVWWAASEMHIQTEDLPDQSLGLFTSPALRIMYSGIAGLFD